MGSKPHIFLGIIPIFLKYLKYKGHSSFQSKIVPGPSWPSIFLGNTNERPIAYSGKRSKLSFYKNEKKMFIKGSANALLPLLSLNFNAAQLI